ncbi:MAG: polysaccharide biosynthesis tyrosine autokinase [Caulobacteraceae bacterium]
MPGPPLTPAGWGEGRGPEGAGGDELDLASLGRALAAHLWLIVAAVAVGLALGAGASLLITPVYKSGATLQIDREGDKILGAGDVSPLDLGASDDEFFQTQYGLLRGRALAERVARTLGLARDGAFIARMRGGKAEAVSPADCSEKVIDLLRDHVGVVPNRGSRLVGVTFSSPDPSLSAQIANTFADDFIAAGLDRRFESSAYARRFLERSLAAVKARLEVSERDLVAYAASQQIIPLAAGSGSDDPDARQSLAGADLESFNTALSGAKADRIRAEARWREARSGGAVAAPEVLQNPTVQQLSQDRAKLAAEYEDKLSLFKPDYPDMVELKARLAETDRQLALQTAAVLASLHGQYAAALANEAALSGQVATLKVAVLDLRGRSIRYTILGREVDTNRALYDGLLQRYKEVAVAGGVAASNIAVVDRARAPTRPSWPKPLLNLLLGGMAGAVAGIALALGREGLDQTVRRPADLESGVALPLLGTVPPLPRGMAAGLAFADPRSPLAEAYQSLCATLRLAAPDGFPASLLITSPWPGGGKSTTALAIAQSQARLGFRVLLIDADLRAPSLHQMSGVDNRMGLGAVLTGAARLEEVIQAGDLANLFLLPAGPIPPNPAELLAGSRFPTAIAEATAAFDVVICDGPPVMDLADAPAIGAAVAATVLIVEAGRTGRSQVRAARRRLEMAGARLIGAVLTRFEPPRGGYGYGYGGSERRFFRPRAGRPRD